MAMKRRTLLGTLLALPFFRPLRSISAPTRLVRPSRYRTIGPYHLSVDPTAAEIVTILPRVRADRDAVQRIETPECVLRACAATYKGETAVLGDEALGSALGRYMRKREGGII